MFGSRIDWSKCPDHKGRLGYYEPAKVFERFVSLVRAQRRRIVNQRKALRELGSAYAAEVVRSESLREELARARFRLGQVERENDRLKSGRCVIWARSR